MSYRSPLARARGLGSAKEGVAHWWMQRLTALALTPLLIWLVATLAMLGHFEREQVLQWVAEPVVGIALICTIIATFYHSSLGVQVVAEDYIHTEWRRLAVIILVNFANFLMAVVAIFAVVKIVLAGAPA